MSAKVWQRLPPVIFGVCWWNKKSVRALFDSAQVRPVFINSFSEALAEAKSRNGCLIGWASRITLDHEARSKASNIPLIRIEDGFLRSVGLGAALAPAASLVLDESGIYFDATRPSDLEGMLEHANLDDAQCRRGADLREKIIQARVSKYNFGKNLAEEDFQSERNVVLVPGQVEDDAGVLSTISDSLDLDAAESINLQLLKAARKNNPNSFIVYKPHPDVTSKLRAGFVARNRVLRFADVVLENVDIIALIERCDKVETLSSLTGFEALLRGKDVVVHGLPFYAGWGLTTDTTQVSRRTRQRTIDELAYIVFVLYCQSVHPITLRSCEPEDLIEALASMRHDRFLESKNAVKLQLARVGEALNPYR